MHTIRQSIDIAAPPERVFDLIHDYGSRRTWDPFLRRADLLNAVVAGKGAVARCVARWRSGGLGMDVVYLSFNRPTVAAVEMVRGPWPIRSFHASITQRAVGDGLTRVTYAFRFEARPRPLAPLLQPIFARFFTRETTARLEALKRFTERGSTAQR